MAKTNGLLIIERILRDRDSIWRQIDEERDLGTLTRDMLVSSSVALACYGAVLGASNSSNPLVQALVSAVKLPVLFLVTLAICLPTLYLFNLVFGARLQVRQALALVLVAITVIATLALAFAPISLFFLITANHYAFYKLLNVAILSLSAIVGLRFLTAGMAALNRHNAVRTAFAEAAAASANAPVSPAVGPVGAAATPAGGTDGPGTGTATPAAGAATATADAAAGGSDAPTPQADAPTPQADAPTTTPAPAPAVVPAPVPVGAPVATPNGPVVPVPVGAGAVPARAGSTALVAYPPMAHRPYGQPMPAPHSAPLAARPDSALAERQGSMTLLYVWIMLFGFVGTQLAWTLRPFFGSPGEKFQIFRSIDGNFYVDIVRTLGHLF